MPGRDVTQMPRALGTELRYPRRVEGVFLVASINRQHGRVRGRWARAYLHVFGPPDADTERGGRLSC